MALSGLQSASLRSLDNDYVKLARDIKPPPAQDNPDNDEELDLC